MSADTLPRPPSVDRVLRDPTAAPLLDRYGRARVTEAVRELLAEIRATGDGTSPGIPRLLEEVARMLERQERKGLAEVFNLTGTVLHTNLGRAILPEEAVEALVRAARNPADLEFDLASGTRGDRDSHLEGLLCELTGAEAATFVNNNAAAVLLLLNSIAEGREVVVSRGELVEIGGSFRIPDIMRKAGCRLVEIGTTNRTHARDYEAAVTGDTALLLKVHTSNYAIHGFTSAVSGAEVANIAHAHDLAFAVDLGSGTLIDLARHGLPHEPTVADTLASGADLVTFSGDKLLGGPQAGLIVGRRDLIDRIKRNPLKRALRVGKLTVAALHALFQVYRDPDRLAERLPTLRQLARPIGDIARAADAILPHVARACQELGDASCVDCTSQIGSGALPLDLLPSRGIAVRPRSRKGDGAALEQIARSFRSLPCPVIGRIHEGAFLLDCRCLEDVNEFIAQLDTFAAGMHS